MGNLGNNLFNARRKAGMSQEVVAEKLGVSRQTISKWETGETIPDIYQSKKLSILYHLYLDDLIEFDVDLKKIEQIIENTDEKQTDKIDWTKAWSKKYSVLACYQQVVDVDIYASKIRIILNELKEKYNYSDLDSMLVLKDILYHEWKDKK